MASTKASCALLLALLLALAAAPSTQAVSSTELSFPMIAAANATKQWTLRLATSVNSGETFTPLNCTSPAIDACVATNPALQQDTGDLLRVDYTLATPRGAGGSLATYASGVPTSTEFLICYSAPSTQDRAWRKKNKPYPRLTQNCPFSFGIAPFNGTANPLDTAANSGTQYLNFNDIDEVPTATWFVMMWVYCGENVCAFESTEAVPGNATAVPPRAPVPGNFLQTNVELGITPGMKVGAIILSIFGPAFFFIFYIADSLYYKKKGKPLRF